MSTQLHVQDVARIWRMCNHCFAQCTCWFHTFGSDYYLSKQNNFTRGLVGCIYIAEKTVLAILDWQEVICLLSMPAELLLHR